MKCPQFKGAICWLVIATLIARAEPRHVSAKRQASFKDESSPEAQQKQLYAFNQPAMRIQRLETLPGPEADAMITAPTSPTTFDDDLRIHRLMEELVLKSRLVVGMDVRAASLPKDYGANAMTRHSNGETNAANAYEGKKQNAVDVVQSDQLEEGVMDSAVFERFQNEVLQNEREAQLAELGEREDLTFDVDQRESSLSAIIKQLSNFYNNTNNGANQTDRSENQFEASLINENENPAEILALGPNIEDVATNQPKQRIKETENSPKDDVIESAVKLVKHQIAAWPLVASNDRPVAVLPTVSKAGNSFLASTVTAAEEDVLEFSTENAEFLNKIFNNKNASTDASNELFYRQSTPTADTQANNNEQNHISLSGFSNKNSNNFSSGYSDAQHSDVFIPEPVELLNPMQPQPTANTSLRWAATQIENANSSAVHIGEIAVKGPESLEVNERTPNKTMAAYEYDETFAEVKGREQSEEESDTNTEASRPAITAAENNVAATNSTLNTQATTTTITSTIDEPMLRRNQSTHNGQLDGAASSPTTAVATSTTYQYGDESVEYVEAAIANFLRREVASPVDTEAQSVAANSNVSATAAAKQQQEFDRTDVIKSAATENENHVAAPVTVGEEVRSTVNCFMATAEASASASAFAMNGENLTGIMETRGAWSITRDTETEQLQAEDKKHAGDDPEQRQRPQFGWATAAAGELQWPARAAAHESGEEDDTNDTNDDDDVGPDSDYAYNDRATTAAEMSTIERQSAAILEKDNGPTYGTRAHMADALHMKAHAANGERNRLHGHWTVHGASGEEDVDADDVDDDGDNDSDEAIHIMSHLYEMDKTIEGDKLSLPPVDDAMKSIDTASAQPAWRRRHEDGKVPANRPHRADVESIAPAAHTNVGEAEITTTNWWHTLSYAEIRKFLNTIFDSAAHELYAEIARKSKEIQSDEKEVAAWLGADATVSINDFWSLL